MGRGYNLLSARFVSTVTQEGRFSDGGGLLLEVRQRGGKVHRTFAFRYRRGSRGEQKDAWIGLGSQRDVSLATARELARKCREALAKGEDPKQALGRGSSGKPTFGEIADQLIDTIGPGFKNKITLQNWKRTLGDTYCGSIRNKPIHQINTDDVVKVLREIWLSKPETATSVRERIERVLDVAKARGLRDGENPARWKGHLKLLLPAQLARKGHHRALAWTDIPDFMRRLRSLNSVSSLALEWTILTCARTSEAIGARRSEVDRDQKVWTLSAARMKEGREHRVPLPDRCIEIFDELSAFGSVWMFPAHNVRKHLSNMAMSECLRGLGDNATVHGFRSTFRDWAGDATEFPREVAEAALSHVLGNQSELAYRRSDALERRRKLMNAWELYCRGGESSTSEANVKDE